MKRMVVGSWLLVVVLALVAGCAATNNNDATSEGGSGISVPLASLQLKPSAGCDDLKRYLEASWMEGFTSAPFYSSRGGGAAVTAGDGPAGEVAASAPPDDVSQTNTQEPGVDEADRIKADRNGYLYAVSNGFLVVEQGFPPGALHEVSRLDLGASAHALYLDEANRRVVVIASAATPGPGPVVLAAAAPVLDVPQVPEVRLMFIDVSDPTQPKFVANWWLPGQREGEEEAYNKWREYGDKKSFTTLHGPMYVPQKIEDGGKYGYSAFSALGMMIHDLSDIKNPKLAGRFYPKVQPGAIPFHTIDIARLNRGFVITNPEALNPDCNEPYQPLWIVDVRNPAEPKAISQLPVPVPPPDAPYRTFCDKRGRFGSHNPPHMKAPGVPDANFTAYTFFNAGMQMFDIKDPAQPRNVGYFIPPQPGSLDDYLSYPRDTDNVFVEWDRKLMWVGTGTGLYLVVAPALGKPIVEPMAVKQWSLLGLNVGHA